MIDYHLIGSADQQLVQERVDRRKADLEKREQKQDRILESHKRGGDVPVFSPSGYAAFKREDAAIASAQTKLEDIASKTWKSQRGELHSVNHHQARVNVNLVLEGAARPAPFDAEGGIGADSQDAHRQMMFDEYGRD